MREGQGELVASGMEPPSPGNAADIVQMMCADTICAAVWALSRGPRYRYVNLAIALATRPDTLSCRSGPQANVDFA